MKKRTWLLLILLMSMCSCKTVADAYKDGQLVACDTADNYQIAIRVDYSFLYNMGGNIRDRKVHRDIIKLMAINASGIIGSKIVSYVLRKAEEYTRKEIESMVNGKQSENQFLLGIKRMLEEEKSLAEVQITSMTMTLVDLGP